MLSILIDKVDLKSDETSPASVEDLKFLINFSDLPRYEIKINLDEINLTESRESINSDDFKFGKSCMFSKTPSGLIKAIRCTPLFIEAYKGPGDSVNKHGDVFATAKMYLPGSICNHVSSKKGINGLSSPCIMKDSFELIDPGGKVAGTVFIVLRLSSLGSSAIKRSFLNGRSFVLEDSPIRKFLCPRRAPESANGDKDSKDGTPLLKRPHSPPRVPIDDPAFKCLTTAEKLNDPKFRELVYRAYPDEPTCSCLPADRSTHPMECRAGCQRSCCMKLRNPDALAAQDRTIDDTLANTYCINKFLSRLCSPRQDSWCKTPRLRGGGDIEQIYLDPVGYKWTDYDTDYPWYDDRNSTEIRLEGGGGGVEEDKNISSCSCTPGKVPLHKATSKETDLVAIFDACKPRVLSTGPQPGCSCPGKNTPTWYKGTAKCSNKPCMGIDCLIRAFNEAQEFVDSIGKVPGLPGLGLMDPSESPYFGRDLDKDYVDQKSPEGRKRDKVSTRASQPTLTGSPPAPPCSAPCSIQPGKGYEDLHSPLIPTSHAPLSFAVPPRLGIVREAIPVLPETGSALGARNRKKEDKVERQKEFDAAASALDDTEMGPCGDPICRSRRKKSGDSDSATQSKTQLSGKGQRRSIKSTEGSGRRGASKGRGKASHHTSRNSHGKKGESPSTKRKGLRGGADTAMPMSTIGRIQGGNGKTKNNKPKETPGGTPLGPGGDRNATSFTKPLIPISRRVMRYVYFVGDTYPGIYYGHKNCIDIPMRVPANMGWLWNTMAIAGNLKPRIGWRPGAIGRNLYEMLQEAKENSLAMDEPLTSRARSAERGDYRGDRTMDRGMDRSTDRSGRARSGRGDRSDRSPDRRRMMMDRAKSAPSRARNASRRRKSAGFSSMQRTRTQTQMEGEEEGPEAPPTLHIHRKDGTYYVTMYPIRPETSDEPRLSEPMKPLQFKIVKNKDEASDASSSTASDMEIEFSPPAAVSRYRKKPDVVHVDTQVRQQQILDAYKVESGKKDKKGKKDKGEKAERSEKTERGEKKSEKKK